MKEQILELLPVFMKYVFGFYLMRTLGEYLLFLGRFTQEMTAYIIAGAYYSGRRDDEQAPKE